MTNLLTIAPLLSEEEWRILHAAAGNKKWCPYGEEPLVEWVIFTENIPKTQLMLKDRKEILPRLINRMSFAVVRPAEISLYEKLTGEKFDESAIRSRRKGQRQSVQSSTQAGQ